MLLTVWAAGFAVSMTLTTVGAAIKVRRREPICDTAISPTQLWLGLVLVCAAWPALLVKSFARWLLR